jgi:hypothetical protein
MIVMLTVTSGMDLSHDLLGFGWFGTVGFSGSSWFGLWYAVGAKPVFTVWLEVGCL